MKLWKLCALFLLPFAAVAQSPDFERESRWRAEVEPTVVVGDAVDIPVSAEGSQRKVFGILTQGKPDRPGVVIVHGVGVHPDHGVIGQLRTQLADLGYTTLSVQMPVLSKEDANPAKYEAVFAHSTARIEAASVWLEARLKRSQNRAVPIVLLSHSMGSWMSNTYFATSKKPMPFAAWVCISITGRIGSTGEYTLPILDIQGENDLEPVKRGSWLRAAKLLGHPGSSRVTIPNANHFYEGHEAALVKAIDGFLSPLGPVKPANR